ncbi:MAG: strawberry notch-like NTP hydrolase domain-containing protein, partial [Promethearchaeia archaeon]
MMHNSAHASNPAPAAGSAAAGAAQALAHTCAAPGLCGCAACAALREQYAARRAMEEQERLEEALDHDVGLSHKDQDEQTFSAYIPAVFSADSFQPHPDEVFETSSLSCLAPPRPSYRLRLCSETITRGLLTNAQLEAISLACAQHQMRLPVSGERPAFFLGDGPGVGKGRAAAGLIFENWLHGRRRALWFSASGDLIADARRDLDEIGAGAVVCRSLRAISVAH